MWPSKELPNFQSTVVSFYQNITDLALRILTVMAIGLELVGYHLLRVGSIIILTASPYFETLKTMIIQLNLVLL